MKALVILFLITISLGCKKDPIPTIEGKWELDKTTYKEYYDGNLVFSQDYEKTDETIEFKPDGQVEVIDQTGKRVGPYTITGDNITFLSMTYQIQDLGENSVTLLDHHVHGPGEYHDTYLHLRR